MAGQHGKRRPHAPVRILHLGASGRLGRLLARAWRGPAGEGIEVVAQWRRAAGAPEGALVWSPLDEPLPGRVGRVDAVIDSSGVTRGGPEALGLNLALARAALEAARRLEARAALLPSSAAVYGAGSGGAGSEARPFREEDEARPASDYGRSKLAAERAASGPPATWLRIGNVAGADALLGGNAPGSTAAIDRLPDEPGRSGRGPRRSYIGPEGLARVLAGLARRAAAGEALPAVLNVAAPGVVGMEALAEAAGLAWRHRPAPEGAIAEVALDTARLEAVLPGAAGPADAAAMVAEWRRLDAPAGAGA